MAKPEQSGNDTTFATLADKIAGRNPDALARIGADLNFAELADHIRLLVAGGQVLASYCKNILPPSKLQDDLPHLVNISAVLDRLADFQPARDATRFNDLKRDVVGAGQEMLTYLGPILTVYPILRNAHVFTQLPRATERISEQLKAASEATSTLRQGVSEARAVMSQLGVGMVGSVFDTASREHKVVARRWLWGTALVFLLLLIAVGTEAYLAHRASSGSQPLAMLARYALMTVLLIGLTYCMSNHRRHMHLWASNRHKAASLGVFDLFDKSTAASDSRATILVEAARSIFSPPPTGYARQSAPETIVQLPLSIVPTASSRQ